MKKKFLLKSTEKMVGIMIEFLIQDNLGLSLGITEDDVLSLTNEIVENYFQYDFDRFFESDPAASTEEMVFDSYKGIDAVIYYRCAHAVYYDLVDRVNSNDFDDEEEDKICRQMLLQKTGRLISEKGAKETTIEINPAAEIGKGLVIDHGVKTRIGCCSSELEKSDFTSVVGQTCVIGKNVTILNGVTLGASDVNNGYQKMEKRHPTIEDNVIICGGVRIFGDITVGENSLIAPFCVITHNIPPNSKVSIINQLQLTKVKDKTRSIIYGMSYNNNIIQVYGEDILCKKVYIVGEEYKKVNEIKCCIVSNTENCLEFSVDLDNKLCDVENKQMSIAIEDENERCSYLIRPLLLHKVICLCNSLHEGERV